MISFKTPYLPSEVGYDSERLEVLNRHFAKMLEANELQSANYCLSRDGKIFANTAMGKLSYKEEDERPVQPDTMWRMVGCALINAWENSSRSSKLRLLTRSTLPIYSHIPRV